MNYLKDNDLSFYSYENNYSNIEENYRLNEMNTENIIFNTTNEVKELNINEICKWNINDVYKWIISLNMRKSILIANAFKEEEIDGEVLLIIEKDDVDEIFKKHNLGSCGLFWLAIFKMNKLLKSVTL